MKFARYLEENVVVEWRRAYINYRGLKKVIKRVDKRYKARTSLELSKTNSHGSSSVRNGLSAAVEGLRRRQRRASIASGGEASDAPIWTQENGQASGSARRFNIDQDTLPQVDLTGTGLRVDRAAGEQMDELDRQESAQTADETLDGRANPSNHTNNQSASHAKDSSADANDAQRPQQQRQISSAEAHNNTMNDKQKKKKGSGKKKEWKRERSRAELDELIHSTFDQQERLFFAAVDSELERIIAFYYTREEDMSKRYEMLARQLEELADHRREYKAQHAPSSRGRNGEQVSGAWGSELGHKISHLVAHPAAKTLNRASIQIRRDKSPARATENENTYSTNNNNNIVSNDEGDKRRAVALSKMLNVYGGAMSETEDEELRLANRLAALSHDPERYKAARKKLKTAVLEYYRGLEILKNYKILNRTGFAKILKKFEKTTEVPCADAYYHVNVAPSVLVASETVEKLLKGTEEIYTAYFEHGNRKRALQRLRVHTGNAAADNQATSHHFSAARTGFYLGIAVCACVGGIVNALHEDTPLRIPLWDQLMRVYAAEFLPTLFALLFGLNLAVWHYARVNAVFIFEWDVRHVLDFRQFFELPAFFMLLLAVCFWVSFLDPFPDAIAATTWPLVWLVTVVVLMLNPFPILHYHARRWFIASMLRVFHAGLLSGVEFRDFFLGDELNSLNWSISMLWFIGCEYKHNWRYPNQCDPNGTYWTAVLLATPAFLRFVQCFRRWRDSRFTARLHLINAGKYGSSILHYFFYIHWRYHGSNSDGSLALWGTFACIYSIYTSAWDIVMDWSLLQPRARFPFLRNELVYEAYWPFYYWAIVTDVILRFGWTIYLLPGPASSLMKIYVIALLESLRRWQWNFLRLENEHLGNVDMYRISREVPLPYRMQSHQGQSSRGRGGSGGTDDEDDDEENDLEATGVKNQRRLPAFGPEAIMRLVRDGRAWKKKTDDEPSRDEWLPTHYPPSQSLSTMQAEGTSSSPPPPALRSNLQHTEGRREGEETSAGAAKDAKERDDESSNASRSKSGSKKLAERLRNALVPDHGGLGSIGSAIADQSAAHGELARDYEPRKAEPANGQNSDEDDDVDSSPAEESGVEDVDGSKKDRTR